MDFSEDPEKKMQEDILKNLFEEKREENAAFSNRLFYGSFRTAMTEDAGLCTGHASGLVKFGRIR